MGSTTTTYDVELIYRVRGDAARALAEIGAAADKADRDAAKLRNSTSSLGSELRSLAAVVGLIAAHSYPAIAPRFLSRCREQGKQALIAAFIVRADRDALVYIAIATLGVLAWRSDHRQSRRAVV